MRNFRLHSVNTLGDKSWEAVFGMVQSVASAACKMFFEFMWNWWSYLVFDHMNFWAPKIPAMAEAIRLKLEKLGCPFEPETFQFFGFIDNTMNATCRPGGGPTRDGENAPRNDPEIQRAWYNGWKKLHGLKWQTIDLPNGMNFHVSGPFSVRDNDLITLRDSEILEKLEALLNIYHLTNYRIYGDSAYVVIHVGNLSSRHQNPNPRESLENRTLSSCRECIEWDYGDIGRYFKLLDYKYILQINKMPVAKMCLCGFILRNALATMIANNTSEYFQCIPPTFEEWTSEGPRQFDPSWTHIDIENI
jgi:nuclease HARBI1